MCLEQTVAEDSGKNKGEGLCSYVIKSWCTDSTVTQGQCCANLEYLMIRFRVFCLPREHTAVIVTAAYIPPDANAKLAIGKQQIAYSDGLSIVAF